MNNTTITTSTINNMDSRWSYFEPVSLLDYWHVINRVKLKLIAASFLVAAIAAIILSFTTPIYQATAILMMEAQDANPVSIDGNYSTEEYSEAHFKTQYQILQSRPIAESVILQLDLLDYLLALGGQQRQPQPEANLQQAAKTYLESLEIEPITNTQLVEVTFRSDDAELAANVANLHAEAYIRGAVDSKLAITQSVGDLISKRLASLKRELLNSELKLQQYLEREGLVDGEQGVQHLVNLELDELTQRLVEAEYQLSVTNNDYLQVRSLIGQANSKLDTVPSVMQDPLVQQFKREVVLAQQNITDLGQRYGRNHKNMIEARNKLQLAQKNLSQRAVIVSQGIINKYEAAKEQEVEIRAQIEEVTAEYHALERKESELAILSREVEINRELYELLYTRMRETVESENLQAANARIISPAITPIEPIQPNRSLIVGTLFLVTLLSGVMVAFVRDAIDNRISNIGQIEELSPHSLFGIVPLFNKNTTLVKNINNPVFYESIRNIRASILLAKPDLTAQTIMVTSSCSDEGKTTLAFNLALSFARTERVLLLEADVRKPSFISAMSSDSVPKVRAGLTDYFFTKERFETATDLMDCDIIESWQGVDVISAGMVKLDPVEMLSSPGFSSMLQDLVKHYDRVIIDTPPVLAVSDADFVARHAELALFVVRADVTTQQQFKAGIAKYDSHENLEVGIVFNALDLHQAEKYRDYGNYFEAVIEPDTKSSGD